VSAQNKAHNTAHSSGNAKTPANFRGWVSHCEVCLEKPGKMDIVTIQAHDKHDTCTVMGMTANRTILAAAH